MNNIFRTCFDEFDRIDCQVLSVVAQQIQNIQKCIRKGSTTFQIDGHALPLYANCAIFSTFTSSIEYDQSILP